MLTLEKFEDDLLEFISRNGDVTSHQVAERFSFMYPMIEHAVYGLIEDKLIDYFVENGALHFKVLRARPIRK